MRNYAQRTSLGKNRESSDVKPPQYCGAVSAVGIALHDRAGARWYRRHRPLATVIRAGGVRHIKDDGSPMNPTLHICDKACVFI